MAAACKNQWFFLNRSSFFSSPGPCHSHLSFPLMPSTVHSRTVKVGDMTMIITCSCGKDPGHSRQVFWKRCKGGDLCEGWASLTEKRRGFKTSSVRCIWCCFRNYATALYGEIKGLHCKMRRETTVSGGEYHQIWQAYYVYNLVVMWLLHVCRWYDLRVCFARGFLQLKTLFGRTPKRLVVCFYVIQWF